MMGTLKQRVALAGCLALTVLSATAGRADAAIVAVYEGQTNFIDPSVPLLGGSGTFAFTAACVAASSGGAVAANLGVCIVATGTYSNIVCGTGTVDGTGTLTTLTLVGTGLDETATFHIQFVGGVGAITGTTGSGGLLIGTAQLIPNMGNCIAPISSYDVLGVLAMDF